MRTVLASFVFVACSFLAMTLFAAGGGDISFNPTNTDPVLFSHDYHLKLRGLKCAACHFTKFAKGAASYEMKQEMITKRGFCVHCHNGMKGFDVDATKNCTRCHKKP